MANIFSNFGNKVGNAFTNLGQGNSLLANQSQIANLSDEDKKKLQQQGLQKFADTMSLVSAMGSGDSQKVALAQNTIRQRQLDEEDAKRKADIETFLKNNPQFKQAYELKNMLGIDMPSAKDNNPNSYKEYALTDNTPTSAEYLTFLDRKQTPEPVPERRYEEAADGFYRFIDDGTKVYPGVEIPVKNPFEIKTTDILSTQKEEKKTFDATNKGVKNFQQLLDAAEAADGAASYALMIKFIKQLDDSGVREGEVNTFGGFQGALTNLKNQISKDYRGLQ